MRCLLIAISLACVSVSLMFLCFIGVDSLLLIALTYHRLSYKDKKERVSWQVSSGSPSFCFFAITAQAIRQHILRTLYNQNVEFHDNLFIIIIIFFSVVCSFSFVK